MPAPGDRFDRFEVEEMLGQGGMATVYRVRHGTLGSHHALKVLDLPYPSIRARLVQEGQLQARLRHPHVVAVTDLIDVEGSPGLIMEFIEGPTLEVWLLGHRPDARTAEWIFSGVLDAVAFAHREGLVHRDLKPANVLLQDVDGRLFPKVADFGIAKLLSGTSTGHQTRTGFAMGTLGYMAPEQVRNAKEVDARADVFALGCILYDLWCGTRAFTGDDVFAILESMEARRYTDPREHRADIPDAVVAAIHGALEPDRDRRIPSCEALRACLLGATTSEDTLRAKHEAASPTLAPPPPPSVATRTPLTQALTSTLALDVEPEPERRRATVVGAAAGLGVAVLLGAAALASCGGAAWWLVRPSEVATEPAVDPAPSPSAPEPTVEVMPEPEAPPEPRRTAPSRADPAGRPSSAPPPAESIVPAPPDVPAPVPSGPVPRSTAPEGTPDAPGRFVLDGQVDSAWLESRGRRFGAGKVAPGTYTLHARWGDVEVERKVTLAPGQTVVATCDATFFDCVVR